jgi:rhodanese-related sulfurtransferase
MSSLPLATESSTDAVAHFVAKLRFETDPSDVHADIEEGARFVFVDSRGDAAWDQGRATGAIHLPTREIAARAPEEIPADMPVVVYCWGPGCNGATRAALEFAKLGYSVKEMIGGYEYWVREGYPTENDGGAITRQPDELTAPLSGVSCAC